MGLIQLLVFNLSLTLASELVIAFILNVRGIRPYIVIVLMNIITNPAINTALRLTAGHWHAGRALFYCVIFLFEALVILTEGLILKKHGGALPVKPYLLSFILNLSSFLTGLLCYSMLRVYSLAVAFLFLPEKYPVS